MNALDRASLDRVDERLARIEKDQRQELALIRSLVDLFTEIMAEIVDPAPTEELPPAGPRHLRLVRDE